MSNVFITAAVVLALGLSAADQKPATAIEASGPQLRADHIPVRPPVPQLADHIGVRVPQLADHIPVRPPQFADHIGVRVPQLADHIGVRVPQLADHIPVRPPVPAVDGDAQWISREQLA